jgi:hypothetical protein
MVRRTCAVCADDDDSEKDVLAHKRAEQKKKRCVDLV